VIQGNPCSAQGAWTNPVISSMVVWGWGMAPSVRWTSTTPLRFVAHVPQIPKNGI